MRLLSERQATLNARREAVFAKYVGPLLRTRRQRTWPSPSNGTLALGCRLVAAVPSKLDVTPLSPDKVPPSAAFTAATAASLHTEPLAQRVCRWNVRLMLLMKSRSNSMRSASTVLGISRLEIATVAGSQARGACARVAVGACCLSWPRCHCRTLEQRLRQQFGRNRKTTYLRRRLGGQLSRTTRWCQHLRRG